ncbi:hypothetical protein BH18THE2_BH18THE2_27360 [soil metagenome]
MARYNISFGVLSGFSQGLRKVQVLLLTVESPAAVELVRFHVSLIRLLIAFFYIFQVFKGFPPAFFKKRFRPSYNSIKDKLRARSEDMLWQNMKRLNAYRYQ